MNFLREEETSDDIVRGTNDDATVSRLSAIKLNYFRDPFVHCFVKKPVRRSPIINRGTYIRCRLMDTIVSQFLQLPGPKKQIVVLGAGFDTRYFNIKAGTIDPIVHNLSENLSKYVEIDFPEITMRKAMAIKKHKELCSLLDNDSVKIERGGMDLKSSDYYVLGGDLRDWEDIVNNLKKIDFNLEAPTLFISECVFIYLAPEDSNAILKWITESMKNTLFALYEQIRPDDAFGKMMIRNLKSRNIELKGIYAYPDLEHQEKRFIDLGWQDAKAMDINAVHDHYISQEELSRLAKLEILDELEEWRLLSAHYCIAWAIHTVQYKDEFNKIQLSKVSSN